MNFYRDENVSVITDTHFGRTFKEGVSLDRRGEYEAKILDDFGEFLSHPQTNIVVHAGDLFDTPEVNYEVLLNVYDKIRNAALENENKTHYYFIAGNHDFYSPLEEFHNYNVYNIVFGKEFENTYKNCKFIIYDKIYFGKV